MLEFSTRADCVLVFNLSLDELDTRRSCTTHLLCAHARMQDIFLCIMYLAAGAMHDRRSVDAAHAMGPIYTPT